MKKNIMLITTFLVVLLIIPNASVLAAKATQALVNIQVKLHNPKVIVNNVDKTPSGIQVINYNGSNYVPIRALSNVTGYQVNYSPEDNTIYLVKSAVDTEQQYIEQLAERDKEIETLRKKLIAVTPDGVGEKLAPVTTPYYTFVGLKGYEDENTQMIKYLDQAVKGAKEEFSDYPNLDQLLKTKHVTVEMQDFKDDKADIGLWSIEGKNDGTYVIHVLYKSRHDRNCCTNVMLPFDDQYFLTTTVHEYITMPLVEIVSGKTQGWNSVYKAPEWFTQGYQEYLGHKYADDPNTNLLYKQLRDNPSYVKWNSDGIVVNDVYAQGFVILQFLNETFGKEKMHKLLLSTEPTFEKAFEKEIGTYADLKPKFEAWFATKK